MLILPHNSNVVRHYCTLLSLNDNDVWALYPPEAFDAGLAEDGRLGEPVLDFFTMACLFIWSASVGTIKYLSSQHLDRDDWSLQATSALVFSKVFIFYLIFYRILMQASVWILNNPPQVFAYLHLRTLFIRSRYHHFFTCFSENKGKVSPYWPYVLVQASPSTSFL